jgi:uncharacterized protein YjbI with pentapeptide repeats
VAGAKSRPDARPIRSEYVWFEPERNESLCREPGQCGLTKSNLTRADLRGSNLDRANFTDSTLAHANLFGANLNLAVLQRADLSNADLRKANCTDAILAHADIRGAHFSGAQLTRADLSAVRKPHRARNLENSLGEERADQPFRYCLAPPISR